MSISNPRKFILQMLCIMIGIALSYGVAMAEGAWTPPPSAPPTGNVDAPINAGSVTQTKTGGLTVSGVTTAQGGFVMEARTTDPTGTGLTPGRMWLRTDVVVTP